MKHTLTVLALFIFSLNVAAQSDIKFGFQMSPTFSWLTTDHNKINANGPNLGLQLGMIGEYFFRENYSFATGIGFHFNAGGKLYYDVDTVGIWRDADIPGDDIYARGTNFKYSVQYVEIPLGLKLRTKEFGYIRYYVEPRLSLAFRTQAKGNIINVTSLDPEEDYNISSAVNLINMSWGIGGGMEYSLSSNTALIGGVSFQSGFTDMTKDKNTTLIINDRGTNGKDDSKGKLNSIVLRLGVMF